MKRSYPKNGARRLHSSASKAPDPPSEPSRVITILREFIEDEGLREGEKLPPERTLAERLKVGRPAIREGIKALSILDALESRRGDGTYIISLKALQTGWPSKVQVAETQFNPLDLLEVRKMFEPKAARLAATRANEAQLRQIEQEHRQIEETSKWTHVARHDFLLHSAIIEAAGNPILIKLSRALEPLLRKSREMTAASAPDRTRMLEDHRAIVTAIMRGEAEAADRAMLEHLHNVGLDLISIRRR